MAYETIEEIRNFTVQRIPYYLTQKYFISKPLNLSQRYFYIEGSFNKFTDYRKFTLEFTPQITERKFLVSKAIIKEVSNRLFALSKAVYPNTSNERKFFILPNSQTLVYTFPVYLTFTYLDNKNFYVESIDRISQRLFSLVLTQFDYRLFEVKRINERNLYSFEAVLTLKKFSDRNFFVQTTLNNSQRLFFVDVLRFDERFFHIRTLHDTSNIYTFTSIIPKTQYTEQRFLVLRDLNYTKRLFVIELRTKFVDRQFVLSYSLVNDRRFIVVQPVELNLYEFKTIFANLKYSERQFITTGFLIEDERRFLVYPTSINTYYKVKKLLNYININPYSIVNKTKVNKLLTDKEVSIVVNLDTDSNINETTTISKTQKNIDIIEYSLISKDIIDTTNIYDFKPVKYKATLVENTQGLIYSTSREKKEIKLFTSKFECLKIDKNKERLFILHSYR